MIAVVWRGRRRGDWKVVVAAGMEKVPVDSTNQFLTIPTSRDNQFGVSSTWTEGGFRGDE